MPKKKISKENIFHAAWSKAVQQLKTESAKDYSIEEKYQAGDKINHDVFGLGIVRSARPSKIDVLFEFYVKVLAHNQETDGQQAS